MLVNLTPHAVTLRVNEREVTLPPSGYSARIHTETVPVATVSVGDVSIPIVETRWGNIEIKSSSGEELELRDDTIYIVSSIVAQAVKPELKARFVVPTDFIRDADGRIIAARALSRT